MYVRPWIDFIDFQIVIFWSQMIHQSTVTASHAFMTCHGARRDCSLNYQPGMTSTLREQTRALFHTSDDKLLEECTCLNWVDFPTDQSPP
jgi:hypothetical protein